MLKKLMKDTHWSWKSWRTQDASTHEKCLGSQLVTRHLGASATHWRSSLLVLPFTLTLAWVTSEMRNWQTAGSGYTIATGVKRFTCRLEVLSCQSDPLRRPLPSCRQHKSRQISRNLFTGLLAWMIESRKFYKENVEILLHPQQIDLFTRNPHFMH